MRNFLIIAVLLSLFISPSFAQRSKSSQPASIDVAPHTSTRGNQDVSPTPQRKSQSTTERGTSTKSSNKGTKTTPTINAPKINTTTQTSTTDKSTTSRSGSTSSGTTTSTKTTGLTPTTTPAPFPTPSTRPAAEVEKPLQVNWMTLEEAVEKSKKEKRKIFVDVYTDWCGWCKRMDETTFTNPDVIKYLNENFYAVKFNAEQQQDITFRGKEYHFKKVGNRGYHELAAEWLNNRLSYPTIVFLNEELELIQPIPNYVEAPRFHTIITYFGTNSYKRTPWETYEKNFVSSRNK